MILDQPDTKIFHQFCDGQLHDYNPTSIGEHVTKCHWSWKIVCSQDALQIGMGLKRYKIKLDHISKIKNLNQVFFIKNHIELLLGNYPLGIKTSV